MNVQSIYKYIQMKMNKENCIQIQKQDEEINTIFNLNFNCN